MLGPLKPTFSTFKVETPLLASAAPLKIRWSLFEASVMPLQGDRGVFEVSGTIRTGVASETLLPVFTGPVEILPPSSGYLDSRT